MNNTSDTRPPLAAPPCSPDFVSECGRVTLYLADCMDVLPALGPVAAVITDPPYGVTACEWDTAPDMSQFWAQINPLCSGKTIITATEPFATDVIISNRPNFRWDDVWVKPPCGMLNKDRPLRAHERLLVFGRGPYTPIKSSPASPPKPAAIDPPPPAPTHANASSTPPPSRSSPSTTSAKKSPTKPPPPPSINSLKPAAPTSAPSSSPPKNPPTP